MRASSIVLAAVLVVAGIALLLARRGTDENGEVGVRRTTGVDAPTLAVEREREPVPVSTAPSHDFPSVSPAEDTAEVTIRGVVRVRSTSRPVPGGRIELWREAPTGDVVAAADGIGKDGTYALRVEKGTVLARASVHPARDLVAFVPTRSDLRGLVADEDRTLDIEVDEGPFVTGVVVDARTGGPLAGAQVAVESIDHRRRPETTGDDGRFRLGGLAGLVVQHRRGIPLVAAHPRYRAARAHATITAEGEPPRDVRIALSPGVSVSGRVVVEAGPIPTGIRVICSVASEPGSWESSLRTIATTEVDSQGRFAFPPIDPLDGATVALSPDLEQGGLAGGARLEGLDLTHDRADLILTVQRPRAVVIASTYPDGSPVLPADTHVLVEYGPAGWWAASRESEGGKLIPIDVARRQRVVVFGRRRLGKDAEEHFRGEDVVDGAIEGRRVVVGLRSTALAEGMPTSGSRSSMGATSFALRTYRLALVDAADGQPIEGGVLQIKHQGVGGGGLASTLGADGRKALTLGLGRWPLRISVDGYEPLDIVVQAVENGSEDVELRLRRSPE
jgi:hypothetical protein